MAWTPSEDAVQVLGPDAASWTPLIDALVPHLKGFEYSFMPDTQYKKLLLANTANAMEVYWKELLYRAHFAAATSIVRMHRWLSGMVGAAKSANLPVFCAAFRGFLEASADSFETLNRIAPTLADGHSLIRKALA